jgi:hypothetical protein
MRLLVLAFLAVASVAAADPLEARIDSAPARTQAGQPLGVRVRLVNTTRSHLHVAIMSCSWPDQWQSSDAELTVNGADCGKNIPTALDLAPGASDVRTLTLSSSPGATVGAHKLRLGFTPLDAKATTWTGWTSVEVQKP